MPTMARNPRNISHCSLSNIPFLWGKNLFVWSVFLIGRKKRESPFKYFFVSAIACCWPREPKKWVSVKKYPYRRCPLYKVDYETIFLDLLGRMFSRKLPTTAHDRSWLSSEIIPVILRKTFYGHHVFLSHFIQQNFFIHFRFVSFV